MLDPDALDSPDLAGALAVGSRTCLHITRHPYYPDFPARGDTSLVEGESVGLLGLRPIFIPDIDTLVCHYHPVRCDLYAVQFFRGDMFEVTDIDP